MTIIPDAKESFPREEIPAMIRANAAAWRAPLGASGASRLYDYRLGLMLTQDDPLYPNTGIRHVSVSP